MQSNKISIQGKQAIITFGACLHVSTNTVLRQQIRKHEGLGLQCVDMFNLGQDCSCFCGFFFFFSLLDLLLSVFHAVDIFVYFWRHCVVITNIRLRLDNITFQWEENPPVTEDKWKQDFYLNATPPRFHKIPQMYFLVFLFHISTIYIYIYAVQDNFM